ncbi:MAG: hypothetical protein ACM37W_05610 [Actinomycetota bacterium]
MYLCNFGSNSCAVNGKKRVMGRKRSPVVKRQLATSFAVTRDRSPKESILHSAYKFSHRIRFKKNER